MSLDGTFFDYAQPKFLRGIVSFGSQNCGSVRSFTTYHVKLGWGQHYATKLDILFTLSRKLEKTREFDILSKMICLHLHNIYFEIGSF